MVTPLRFSCKTGASFFTEVLTMPDWTSAYCERCDAPINQAATGRPRRFCSPACKQAAYRGRVTKVNKTGAKGPNKGQTTQTHRIGPQKRATAFLAGQTGRVTI